MISTLELSTSATFTASPNSLAFLTSSDVPSETEGRIGLDSEESSSDTSMDILELPSTSTAVNSSSSFNSNILGLQCSSSFIFGSLNFDFTPNLSCKYLSTL